MRLSFVTENTVDVASDVNQSLLEADGLIVSRVTGIEIAPPAVLIDGLRVAIASGATGAFAGKAGQLGVYVENGAFWQFYSPALCVFDGVTYLSAGGDWIQSSGGASTTDPRFTDAREWSAATISQAEVEAGTATTRRAFTAQRLRQGITAWYTGISGAIGRTILGRGTAAEVRGDLGLGTAATKDAVSSNTDTTSGRLLQVGSGGWLSNSYVNGLTNMTQAVGNTSTFAWGTGSSGFPSFAGQGLTLSRSGTSDNNILMFSYEQSRMFLASSRQVTGEIISTVEVCTTGNMLQTTGTSTTFPMSQKATTDQLATKANTSTQVIAGTGLTGGGTLAADRTLTVSYGTTAGTSVQGNDSRVVNALQTGVSRLGQSPNPQSSFNLNTDGMQNGMGLYYAGGNVGTIGSSFETSSPVFVGTEYSYADRKAYILFGNSALASGSRLVARYELYHTSNTTKDPDGTLKASSPVINLYTDRYDLHNESQFGADPAVTRKSKGVYEITGTLGLRSEGWYLDTPSDRNGNKYLNIEWTQNITPDAVDGVVEEYRDDIVVTIETFERVWNKETGMFDNGTPMDINDLQDRFVQLRFNEIKVEHEELVDESQ